MSQKPPTLKKELKKVLSKEIANVTKESRRGKKSQRPAKIEVVERKPTTRPTKSKPRPASKLPITRSESAGERQIVQRIIKDWTMPKDFSNSDDCPVRFSSEYTDNPTAVATPWERHVPVYGVTTAPDNSMAAGETYTVLFRDPLRNLVFYDGNPTNTNWRYDAWFYPNSSKDGVVEVIGNSYAIADGILDWTSLPVAYAKAYQPYAPHGPKLYCGAVEGSFDRFLWMNKGDSMTVLFTCPGGNANPVNCSARLSYFDGEAPLPLTEQTANFGTNVNNSLPVFFGPVSLSGYYGLQVKSSTTGVCPDIATAMNISGNGPVHCHRALPGFEGLMPDIESIRIKSLTMLWTNTAAALVQNGRVSGLQTPASKYWFDYVYKGIGSINSLDGSVTLQAATGLYGFVKPVQVTDMDLITDWKCASNTADVVYTGFPIISRSPMLVFIAASSADPTQLMSQFTTVTSIEFQTNNVFFELEIPSIDPSLFSRSLNSIKGIRQFHENPLHIAEIWNRIKSTAAQIVNGVIEYGPGAIKTAQTLATLF